MISMKRLVEMARKWQKTASQRRKRISSTGLQKTTFRRKSAAATEKGHFVAYAADGKRYVLPLAYLQRPLLQELLEMAEEESGLNFDGAITLHFDSQIMDYVTSLLHRGDHVSQLVEDALLVSLSGSRCSASTEQLPQSHTSHHLLLEGF